MKNVLGMLFAASLLAVTVISSAMAGEILLKFNGGIGVVPVSSVAGTQNADGTFPNANRNDVRGIPPGGQPWVIESLKADVTVDGRIRVDGEEARIEVGDLVYVPPGGKHQLINDGEVVFKVLAVVSPPFIPEKFKKDHQIA